MGITNELLAAYAEGNVSESERNAVRQYLTDHPDRLETVMIMMDEDFDIQLDSDNAPSSSFNHELDALLDEIDSEEPDTSQPSLKTLPLLSKAARNTVDNLCAVRCEGYALRSYGIKVSDEVLEQKAKKKNWLSEDGMPLHNIGLLSGFYKSYVTRNYCCTLDDISKALNSGKVVITVIDNTELNLTPRQAMRQDIISGQNPNHAVVIKSIDIKKKKIEIFDPGVSEAPKTYPLDVFAEAWNDSINYLVTITNYTNYDPQPQDLSGVELEDELIELREAIAENAHEVWALTHKLDGWTYGRRRSDKNKKDPDMRPYQLLPESVKTDYRKMAISTIKLVKMLGWDLVKRK